MKIHIVLTLFILLLSSCDGDEPEKTINSPGLVKLDNIGAAGDGWGIHGLVVSHNGNEIYYAVGNVSLGKYELRSIDSQGSVQTILKGEGQVDALNISTDDKKLVYSLSGGNEFGSRLYEFKLDTRISGKVLTVIGDGYFWNTHYLHNGEIVFNQGDGTVGLSLRRINPGSKEVTVLLGKEENPILVDKDVTSGRLLLYGWSNSTTMTIYADGTGLNKFEVEPTLTRPVAFSPDGTEILAFDQGDLQAPTGSIESQNKVVSFNSETGAKSIVLSQEDKCFPQAYGADKNEIICRVGKSFPLELASFDRNSASFFTLTDNQQEELFLGYYGNSSRRVLFSSYDASSSGLYIHNR